MRIKIKELYQSRKDGKNCIKNIQNIKVEHKLIGTLPENKKNLFIIKYALAEAMAIYGLTLFLMNGNFSHLILFSGLAVVGMLLSYPKK